MKAKFLIPLVVFIILVGFLAVGLQLKPSEVPSPLIGKPAPAFTLPTLADPKKTFSPSDFKGKVWLFNVWASWCVACKEEHPVLMHLAKQNRVAIVGLDYKDQRDAALTFLQRGGDPYLLSVVDQIQTHWPRNTKSSRRKNSAAGGRIEQAMRQHGLPLILAFLCSVGFAQTNPKEAAPLAQDPIVEKRLNEISEEMRCLVCQNESLAGSRSELALDLRREIRTLIKEGKSNQEIRDFMVSRYGDFVLYRPPVKSTTLLLWIGPFVLMVGGFFALMVALKRRRKNRPTTTLSVADIQKAETLLRGEKQ